jgi:hypothetical protein
MMNDPILLVSENCDIVFFERQELRTQNITNTEGREGTMASKNRKSGKDRPSPQNNNMGRCIHPSFRDKRYFPCPSMYTHTSGKMPRPFHQLFRDGMEELMQPCYNIRTFEQTQRYSRLSFPL